MFETTQWLWASGDSVRLSVKNASNVLSKCRLTDILFYCFPCGLCDRHSFIFISFPFRSRLAPFCFILDAVDFFPAIINSNSNLRYCSSVLLFRFVLVSIFIGFFSLPLYFCSLFCVVYAFVLLSFFRSFFISIWFVLFLLFSFTFFRCYLPVSKRKWYRNLRFATCRIYLPKWHLNNDFLMVISLPRQKFWQKWKETTTCISRATIFFLWISLFAGISCAREWFVVWDFCKTVYLTGYTRMNKRFIILYLLIINRINYLSALEYTFSVFFPQRHITLSGSQFLVLICLFTSTSQPIVSNSGVIL